MDAPHEASEVPPKQWLPEEIAQLVASTVFRFSTETELQEKIGVLFQKYMVPFEREFVLSPKDRVDFISGSIGIEVKVDSSSSMVQRQLWRYAADERIKTLLLITTRTKHKEIAREILGKKVIIVHLLASIF